MAAAAAAEDASDRERARARGGGRQGAVAKAVTAAGVVCAFEKRWDLHRRL